MYCFVKTYAKNRRKSKFNGVLGSKLLTAAVPIGFPKLCLSFEWEDLVGKANIAVTFCPPKEPIYPTSDPQRKFLDSRALWRGL